MVQYHKKSTWILLFLSVMLVLAAFLLQDTIQVSFQQVGAFQPFGAWYDKVVSMSVVPAARKQGAMVGIEQVTLYAVDELWQNVFHSTLYEGRSITKRDVELKTPCIVLSESTARRLFPSGDVLGQKVATEGVALEVVGLIRDGNTWGETDDAVAFIPVSLDISLDTLCLSIPQTEVADSAAIWENSLRGILPGGTFHNLRQMHWIAWLPFYVTFLFFLARGLSWSYKTGKGQAVVLWQKNKLDLQTHYFGQVWFPVTGRSVLLLLLGMTFLASVWGILQLYTLPLSVFPEYVPENLVQLSSWQQIVDAILKKADVSRQYLSRESSSMKTVCFLAHTAYLFFSLGIYRKK